MTSQPSISVIIPTYHDWQRLELCLAALSDQTVCIEDFEIIIVNNDPSDPVPKGLKIPKNARIISEAKPGSYAARNSALPHSRAELLSFTDSDCIPEKTWLEHAISHMRDAAQTDLIAGAIRMFYKSEKPTAVELYDSIFCLKQDQYAAAGFAATANIIVRRQVFDSIGPFNETLMSGGDKEWTMRATKSGHGLVYAPDVAVHHPARHSLSAMKNKSKRIAGGVIAKKRSSGSGFVLPQIDRVLPSIRIAKKLYNDSSLGLWDGIKVWLIHYRIKLAILAEQIRLMYPSSDYRR